MYRKQLLTKSGIYFRSQNCDCAPQVCGRQSVCNTEMVGSTPTWCLRTVYVMQSQHDMYVSWCLHRNRVLTYQKRLHCICDGVIIKIGQTLDSLILSSKGHRFLQFVIFFHAVVAQWYSSRLLICHLGKFPVSEFESLSRRFDISVVLKPHL